MQYDIIVTPKDIIGRKIMTNKEILDIAFKQSAADLNCSASDFTKSKNVIVHSEKNENARIYLELPFICDLVSYGSNIVASAVPEVEDAVMEYLKKTDTAHAFETPSIYLLNEALKDHNAAVCFMAEYWLPDLGILKPLPINYETKVLHPEDFKDLYLPEWSNALCEKRSFADVLGVGAYDNGKLIGLAGCSADCRDMWQIGIDVLPEYRRQGIASALTSRLALEIIDHGKVPFYCCAWCNIRSAKNAIKSGFRPAWNEMTVKSNEYIDKTNGIT